MNADHRHHFSPVQGCPQCDFYTNARRPGEPQAAYDARLARARRYAAVICDFLDDAGPLMLTAQLQDELRAHLDQFLAGPGGSGPAEERAGRASDTYRQALLDILAIRDQGPSGQTLDQIGDAAATALRRGAGAGSGR